MIYILLYLLPAGLLFHLALDILGRNMKNTEHLLLSGYIGCYGILFFSEFMRHLVDVSYSPFFITYLFGNAGLLLFSFSLHFIFKVTKLGERMPKWVYPWVFYLPVVIILFTVLFQTNVTNSASFEKVGYFIYPEFNASYLITMTVGNVFHFLVVILLLVVHRRLQLSVRRRIIRLLAVIASFVLVWDIIFGYVQLQGSIPPYPYIYGGMIWTLALGVGMKRFDFLASYSHRFSILYDLNPSSILLLDARYKIDSANPATKKLLELPRVQGKDFLDHLSIDKKEETIEHLNRSFLTGKKFSSFETMLRTTSGSPRHVLMDGDFLLIDQRVYLMLIIRDIQVMKEAEETIRFLAYNDALTELPNRRSFYESAEKELSESDTVAFLILDLDGFKSINDTYGHQTGDDFLIHVARFLETHIGKKGTVARVGGDEFYAVLPAQSKQEVERFERSLREAADERPFRHGQEAIPIRYSLGISLYPEHGETVESLISKADRSMYQVKKNGKNGSSVWVR
ncbi:diguanylate cyclase [Halobacillus litoralis]|uniref:sensor domain-containing diguanylate cyclase n=1 Tax=Halobacillus litoralis TaxID=45668 RepID=UPI001CD39F9C|nr:diguanylate cyclase [Halobacillus litoralis]MCA0970738.1 diguanylate cyclase [Halobacillus litoralis]